MKLKKLHCLIIALFVLVQFTACMTADNTEQTVESQETEQTTSQAQEEPTEDSPSIAVIANRSFGDKGSIDSQLKGLEYAESLGWQTKQLESLSPDVYEADIRAMADEGYDIIVTSFPPVQIAVEAVSKDYPDTDFVGIYQYTNLGEEPYENIWSIEYRSQEMMYGLGVLHAKLSTNKKVGIMSGQESATSNAAINSFMQGVKDTDPSCSVEFAFAGSYDDPAKGREVAMAMIERGVDTICLTSGKTNTGAIEAAQEAGVFTTGDNSDFYEELGPNTLVCNLLADFGTSIVQAVDAYEAGEFPGGEHGVMSIYNEGTIVEWDQVERYIGDNPDNADLVQEALDTALAAEAAVVAGEIEVEFNTNTPVNLQAE